MVTFVIWILATLSSSIKLFKFVKDFDSNFQKIILEKNRVYA